jgi:hypothetical protein
MKAAALFAAVVSLSVFGVNAVAQESCATGGQPPARLPLGSGNPTAAEVFEFLSRQTAASSVTNAAPQTAVPRQSAPVARIRVVDPSETLPRVGSAGGGATAGVPTARVTVVDDAQVTPARVSEAKDAVAKVGEMKAEASNPAAKVVATTGAKESETLDSALAGLVGTWKGVARYGDGELTTIELQLDNRGWVELTLPGSDGKPSTIKRRAELDGQELKLIGPDADMVLGKLLEVNSRQMVLAQAEGQLTLVRPR